MDETKELFNDVKAIMATQLTELEVIVYLLIEGGYSDYKVADLPLGISRSTAGRLYKSAKIKMDTMANAGLFTTAVTKRD